MKNKDLITLNTALQEVSNIKGKDFAYAVFKNKNLIEKELEIFNKLQREPHPEFRNYEQERNILCITHSVKDENGNPNIKDNKYEIDAVQQVDFQNEFEDLKEEYKEVIEDMQQAEKDYNDFLEKDSLIVLIKVKFNDLPEEVDAVFLERIKYMID